MKRRLFNLVTILSLLICIASAGMWVRSYWWADERQVWRGDERFCVDLRSWRGRLMVSTFKLLTEPRTWPDAEYFAEPDQGPDLVGIPRSNGTNGQLWWERGGFGMTYGKDQSRGDIVVQSLMFPHWFLCLLTAILPLYRLMKKRRRPPPGHCATCGYDLRATPDRCPECGTIAQAVHA